MANPQPTDSHLRIAHAITEELMMRDFSKLQRNILDFILRLSWGCGKKYAVIPKLKDFEICGVDHTKIKKQLCYLVNANVIRWEPATNKFSFNKDYDSWKISIVQGYDKNRLFELVRLNLSCDDDTVAETATELPKKQVAETSTLLPKRKQSCQKSNISELPKKQLSCQNVNKVAEKKQLLESSNPHGSKAGGSPIKNIYIKDSSSIDTNYLNSTKEQPPLPPLLTDEILKQLATAYEENGFGKIYPAAADTLIAYAEQYTKEWVLLALQKASEAGARNLRYVKGILKGWEKEGMPNMDLKQEQQESQPSYFKRFNFDS